MPTIIVRLRWTVYGDNGERIAKCLDWKDAVMIARANNSQSIEDDETGRRFIRRTVTEYVCNE